MSKRLDNESNSSKEPLEYRLDFRLKDDIFLKIIYDSEFEQRWIYDYEMQYRKDGSSIGNPDVVNKNKVNVKYIDGTINSLKTSMEIIIPPNRGKIIIAGLDISPNSHFYLEFIYQKQGDSFIIDEVFRDSNLIYNSKSKEKEGIIKSNNIPFPIKDEVKNEFGTFFIPYLDSNLKQKFFEIREKYTYL